MQVYGIVKATVQLSLDLTDLNEALQTAELAVRAGIDWLEVGTPLIIAEGNIASERVAQKCGFTYEGTARQAMFARGRHFDMKLYSLLRHEVETCLPSRLFSSGATPDR